MSKVVTFNRVVTLTITTTFDKVEECNCEDASYLNDLPCGLCSMPVGKERPLGIAWGRVGEETQTHGMRLCNKCYMLAVG